MPTGLTAGLYDGEQSFEDYAWGVARQFGALVHMRDDPQGVEIKRAEPYTYHVEAAERNRDELDRLRAMTDEEILELQFRQRDEDIARRKEERAKREGRRSRYSRMLARVWEYQPPTPDHVAFRDLMESQLTDSIKHDCFASEYEDPSKVPDVLASAEYRREREEFLQEELARHEEEHQKDLARCAVGNEWVDQLAGSLA